jgi:hypothetical protein
MSNELPKRATACKGWRWMPGSVTVCGLRIVWVWPDGSLDVTVCGVFRSRVTPHFPRRAPDLTDPATLGCLLQLVREAYSPALHLTTRAACTDLMGGLEWSVPGFDIGNCSTEAEALVAALEAAEGRGVSDE